MDLITRERAKQQLTAVCDDSLLSSLITAASSVIEKYCRRTFQEATYDELLDGTNSSYLYVTNPPIQKVYLLRTGQQPAITITYPDSTNQTQLVTVDVTSTAVVLTKIYNNVTTTNTFLFATYPTFGALRTAINLVSGYSATVPDQFLYWQTSDLVESLGSFSAKNQTVNLPVFGNALNGFKVDSERGEIYSPYGFGGGYKNFRVSYLGGYNPIPEDLQYACACLVQLTFASRKTNPLMQSESLDKYSYTKMATTNLNALDPAAKMALDTYKLSRMANFR